MTLFAGERQNDFLYVLCEACPGFWGHTDIIARRTASGKLVPERMPFCFGFNVL